MTKKIKAQLAKLCNGTALFDEPMANWTSFKVGGPAGALVMPRSLEALRNILALVGQENLPYLVIGRGTNLIVGDGGFRGVAISLQMGFKRISLVNGKDPNTVLVAAEGGVYLPKLVKYAAKAGFSGLEFAAGIPGSVGGAIAMNAGSWGREIKDCLEEINGLDSAGKIKNWKRSQLSFRYRSLSKPSGIVVLSGVFALQKNDPRKIQDAVHANLARKRTTQPLRQPSAGSIFRNPPGMTAAELIDKAGLKGTRRGDALVSRKHANFIVNAGQATASDILQLMALVRDRVHTCFGVKLEPEVEIIGAVL